MAIPLEYFCKQLSELQKNDPDKFIRSLMALNDVGALEAISNVMYGNGGWGAKVIEWAVHDGGSGCALFPMEHREDKGLL